MKVIKKKGENGHITLDVTASSSEVSEALNQASIAFCAQMGIRPMKGKTPAQLASEVLGIKNLDQAVAVQATEMLVAPALDKHNIIPAFTPTPIADAPIKRGKAYQFKLDVLSKPSYELKDYSPVSFTIQDFQSDEEEVDRQIGELVSHYTIWVDSGDKSPLGAKESCKLKIHVEKNGEVVPGLTTEGRTYTTGEDLMPPGFDEGIIGMEIGETRTFTFEGPALDEDMNEIMETFDTTVTLLEKQKEVVPVADDEWVKRFLPMYSSYDDMRAKIQEKVDEERRKYYEDYKRNQAARALSERFEGTIPDEVYEGAMREEQKKLRQQIAKTGKTWEQFCEEQGGEQQVNMLLMVSMRQSLVQGYCLDAYYRHEGLSYTEEDLDDSCFQLNPKNPHAIRQQMERNGLGFALRESAERLRACKHLIEHANIKVVEPTDSQMPSVVAGS